MVLPVWDKNDQTDRERFLSTLISNLPGFVYRCANDRDWTMAYISDGCREITGYDPADFLGNRSIAFNDIIMPEHRDRLWQKWQRLLEKKDVFEEEYPIRTKSGETRWVWERGRGIFADEGRLLFLEGFVTDVTTRKRTEEELAKKTEDLAKKSRYYQLLLHTSTDAIHVLDCKGMLREWNDAFLAQLGCSAEEAAQLNVTDWNAEYPPDEMRERIAVLIREGGRFETRHRRKDGSVFDVEITATAVVVDGEERLYASARDITGRKKAEAALNEAKEDLEQRVFERTEALRRSEEQLQLKLDAVLSPDMDIGNQELANVIDHTAIQSMMEDFSRLTGLASAILDLRGNIIEATGWQDICTRFHRGNEMTAQFCTESDLYLAKNMKPGEFVAYKCSNGLWDVVTPLYIGDNHVGNIYTGQFFYDDEVVDEAFFVSRAEKFGFNREEYLAALHRVPRIGREKVQHLMNYLVKFAGFISRLSYSNLKLARAIADYQRAEAAIRQSEERYRTLFENSGSPLIIIDADTTIVQVNREFEKASGYTNEELAGRTSVVAFVAVPADREKVLEFHRLRRITPGQVPTNYEIRIKDRAGTIKDMILSAALIPGTQQSLIAFVNITGRNQAELELRKLYNELEQRVSERTWELSLAKEAYRQANEKLNLLSSITRHDITNQLLALKGYLDVSKQNLRDPARVAGFIEKEWAIADTIEHQITFTRYYQDMGVSAPAWQNVSGNVRKAAASLPVREIAVTADSPDLEVYADPLFEKVFYNLIDNALRYGGDRMTRIRISSEETGSGLLLVCEDDGGGISDADREHLFERGYGKNTGLGLFLVREILGITGITIRETGSAGKGARFEMTVPEGAFRFADRKDAV